MFGFAGSTALLIFHTELIVRALCAVLIMKLHLCAHHAIDVIDRDSTFDSTAHLYTTLQRVSAKLATVPATPDTITAAVALKGPTV